MPMVYDYEVAIYGGPEGLDGDRARIFLHAPDGQQTGTIHFRVPGAPLRPEREGRTVSHIDLPEAMIATITDLLRNEKPIFFPKTMVRSLRTGKEPVGEGEE